MTAGPIAGAGLTAAEADALIRNGVAALQRGAPREARRAFEQVVAAGGDIAPPWLLVAQACRMEGDEAAERHALERLLDLYPRHVRGLVMKGDLLARAGELRSAHSFWRRAVEIADAGDPLPPQLAGEIARCRAALADGAALYAAHLRDAMAARGFPAERLGPRLQEALAIVNGERQIYLQQPTSFYFPGLPQIQFYERTDFAWAEAVEAATADVRDELMAVLADTPELPPYIEHDPTVPHRTHRLADNPAWGAYHLLRGDPVPGQADRCPKTLAALAHAGQPVIRGRSPMALFSLLKPGAHIFPHHGMLNTRLICHLPLVVPPGCRLRVGNETRAWEEGRLMVFDDSIEHEAWNDGQSFRVILLFEIWRPEIAAEERAALTALFESIDAFRGGPPDMSG